MKGKARFFTALNDPSLKAQGEILPVYRETLDAGVQGGHGNGASRGTVLCSCQLCGRLWRVQRLFPLFMAVAPLKATTQWTHSM